MNNKKFLNGIIPTKLSQGHSSLSELNIENSKELFNIFNNKQNFSEIKRNNEYISSITQKNKDKYLKENDLLNISKKEKNRTIKQITKKEKDDYLYGNYVKNRNPCKCGNVYCFCYIFDYPLFTLGSQYYYSIILFLINNLLFFLINGYVYNKYNVIYKVAGIIIFIIVNYTQLYTTLINEGIPSKKWFLSNKIINYLI